MAHNIHGTFVSEKVNKLRWRPTTLTNSSFFLTGSWDNDENSIKLWDFQENEEDDDIYPYLITDYKHKGDVTELLFVNEESFVSSSSKGSVCLYKIQTQEDSNRQIREENQWNKIHYFGNGDESPCTALALQHNDLVSVGEDGRINLLNIACKTINRQIDNADSCTINRVIFLKHNEILTSNLRGQLKIWDLRDKTDQPSNTFMLSDEQISSTCLTHHPTQQHLVVAGDEEGSLTVWDLRQNTYPINVLDAHDGSLTEIQFHPDHPDNLFTCASSGEIWHWAPKADHTSTTIDGLNKELWLTSVTIKNRLEVFTLMPKLHKSINCLDLNGCKVLCGCDNEAVYLINEIKFSG